mmetsp:Transcript_31083/g.66860  ORF Transcript_31083/g.66860 Transcript_31083/m.66860 type:complete len:200 (-) Transcript_31083:2402-3001(-)
MVCESLGDLSEAFDHERACDDLALLCSKLQEEREREGARQVVQQHHARQIDGAQQGSAALDLRRPLRVMEVLELLSQQASEHRGWQWLQTIAARAKLLENIDQRFAPRCMAVMAQVDSHRLDESVCEAGGFCLLHLLHPRLQSLGQYGEVLIASAPQQPIRQLADRCRCESYLSNDAVDFFAGACAVRSSCQRRWSWSR